MNLKSYSRGIGAGIIVAAVIMGISSNKRTITDAEAIARAKELGYTQSSVLTQTSASDSKEEKVTSISDSATSISIISIEETDATKYEVTEPASVLDSKKEDTSVSTSDKTSTSVSSTSVSASASDDTSVEDPKDDEKNKPSKSEESVLITINRGDSSVTVSRRMYEAGLVESAVEFDQFLCANGYDKYLAVGEYEIIFGLDFDTMAKIITRSKMN